MITIDSVASWEFRAALAAPTRSIKIPEAADAYGWLVGSWDLDVFRYWGMDVSELGLTCEVHAAWVLDGYGIQDVWIMPRRTDRTSELEKTMNMYGSTLRVWDSAIQAWRISWRNPTADHFEDQIGRREGKDVVQLGTHPDGSKTRWTFTEITPESFHWLGEVCLARTKSWKLQGEFRGRKI